MEQKEKNNSKGSLVTIKNQKKIKIIFEITSQIASAKKTRQDNFRTTRQAFS